MNLTLSDEDVHVLRGLLHDYLPELKYQAARAEATRMRHLMTMRQTLCERLLAELERAEAGLTTR